MKNPFLKRQEEAPRNAHGKRSEARLAKALGGRLTPASGATAGAKGDIRHQGEGFKVLMEAKSTTSKTMALEYNWLVKIEGEALDKRSIPALSISFVDPQGRACPRGEWICIPLYAWQELLEKKNGGGMAE